MQEGEDKENSTGLMDCSIMSMCHVHIPIYAPIIADDKIYSTYTFSWWYGCMQKDEGMRTYVGILCAEKLFFLLITYLSHTLYPLLSPYCGFLLLIRMEIGQK